MKTTIELPDALLQRAKVVSARRKTTLKNLVIEGLESILEEPRAPEPVSLTPEQEEKFEIGPLGFPVIRRSHDFSEEEYSRTIEEIRGEALI
ncbi:MAG: hypothetical protein AAF236_10555 [Verrucomicrobiota bacterium]